MIQQQVCVWFLAISISLSNKIHLSLGSIHIIFSHNIINLTLACVVNNIDSFLSATEVLTNLAGYEIIFKIVRGEQEGLAPAINLLMIGSLAPRFYLSRHHIRPRLNCIRLICMYNTIRLDYPICVGIKVNPNVLYLLMPTTNN